MNIKKLLFDTKPIAMDIGILLLRLVIGMNFINHGHGLFDETSMKEFTVFLSNDLHFPYPVFMAYLRTAGELFGGIMLVLGLFTRFGAFLIMFTMFVAVFTAGNGDLFGQAEITFLYAISCLSIILLGSGKYAIDYIVSDK
jgi:putative oxidoreductase